MAATREKRQQIFFPSLFNPVLCLLTIKAGSPQCPRGKGAARQGGRQPGGPTRSQVQPPAHALGARRAPCARSRPLQPGPGRRRRGSARESEPGGGPCAVTRRAAEPGSLECALARRRRAPGTLVRSVRSGCVPGPRHASPAQTSRRRWGGGAQGPGEPGGCASSLPCTRKGGRAGVSAPGARSL